MILKYDSRNFVRIFKATVFDKLCKTCYVIVKF